MTPIEFCYWLQGAFELMKLDQRKINLNDEQVECIQRHLSLVFHHVIDPSYGDKVHQAELSMIHNPETTEPYQGAGISNPLANLPPGAKC